MDFSEEREGIEEKSIISTKISTTKSCPGSNFFGGNNVEDAENNFFPLVRERLEEKPTFDQIIQKYVDKGLINSPSYWCENAREGKTVEGGYMSILLQRITQTICRHDACDKLVELGLMNSPEEWIPNLLTSKLINGEYAKILLERLYNII